MQWKAEFHLNYIPTGKEVNGPDSYLEGRGKAESEPSPTPRAGRFNPLHPLSFSISLAPSGIWQESNQAPPL